MGFNVNMYLLRLMSILGITDSDAITEGMSAEDITTAINNAAAVSADPAATRNAVAEAWAEMRGAASAEGVNAASLGITEGLLGLYSAAAASLSDAITTDAATTAALSQDLPPAPVPEPVDVDANANANANANADGERTEPDTPAPAPAVDANADTPSTNTNPRVTTSTNPSIVNPSQPEATPSLIHGPTVEGGTPQTAQEFAEALVAAATVGGYGANTTFGHIPVIDQHRAEGVLDTEGLIAASCVDTGPNSVGSCVPPAYDNNIIDCSTVATPIKGITIPSPVDGRPGQARVWRSPMRLRAADVDAVGEWTQANRENLFQHDANGIVFDANGRPVLKTGQDMIDAMKTCPTFSCGGAEGIMPSYLYACIQCLPNDLDPAMAEQVRLYLESAINIKGAQVVADTLFNNANWVVAGNETVNRNSVAYLLNTILSALSALSPYTAGNVTNWDLIGPSWLPNLLAPENYVRENPLAIGTFAALTSELARAGVRYVGSVQGFGAGVKATMGVGGYPNSDWVIPETPNGTFSSPATQSEYPTSFPLFLAPAGSVIFESTPYIRMGFESGRLQDRTNVLKNCVDVFAENTVISGYRSCVPPTAFMACFDPYGMSFAEAPLPDSSCAKPVPLAAAVETALATGKTTRRTKIQ